MRPTAVLTGLAGIVVVIGVIGFGADRIGRETDILPAPASQTSTIPDGSAVVVPPAAGTSTPSDGQTAPADSTIATPPPAPSPPPPAEPVVQLQAVDLAKPFAERAGVLKIGDRTLQLSGVTPTDPNRVCSGENGKEWPCGMVARTALRMFLRGRTVTCDLPSEAWQGEMTTQCRYVKTDLGQWLVQNGWAEAASGSPLASLGSEARDAKRGIFGEDPRDLDGPSTLGPAPVREDPLNPL